MENTGFIWFIWGYQWGYILFILHSFIHKESWIMYFLKLKHDVYILHFILLIYALHSFLNTTYSVQLFVCSRVRCCTCIKLNRGKHRSRPLCTLLRTTFSYEIISKLRLYVIHKLGFSDWESCIKQVSGYLVIRCPVNIWKISWY